MPPAAPYSLGIARYYALFRPAQSVDAAAAFLAPLLAPGMRALDIGAGTGHPALTLAARGVHVTALEPDPAMFDILFGRVSLDPQGGAYVTPLRQAAGYPLEGGFDLVYCFSLLHLLPAAQRGAVMAYCAAQLRPGGRLVLECPVVSDARRPDPMRLAATRTLGDLHVEHHAGEEPAGDGWWDSHWIFRAFHGGRQVDEASRTFRWYALPVADTDALLDEAGLTLLDDFGDRMRGAFVTGMSLNRLIVARR